MASSNLEATESINPRERAGSPCSLEFVHHIHNPTHPQLTNHLRLTKKTRHPERSAAPICRMTNGLTREVEGPRRCPLADALPSFPATNYKPNQKSHKL